MGMAASQARLLTITARLADNELRSQTINNAKMRLATQSSQASENYINALNNATLTFTNYDLAGETLSQALTFNALTAYSSYNTQYGLVNSSGQILVNETEAAIFAGCGNNLNNFLKAHGLEYKTTYFETLGGFTSEAYPAPYDNISVEDLEEYYQYYTSFENSVEVENFENAISLYANADANLYKAGNQIMKDFLLTEYPGIVNLVFSDGGFTLEPFSNKSGSEDLGTLLNQYKNLMSSNSTPYGIEFLHNNNYINDETYKNLIEEINRYSKVAEGTSVPPVYKLKVEEEISPSSVDGNVYTFDDGFSLTILGGVITNWDCTELEEEEYNRQEDGTTDIKSFTKHNPTLDHGMSVVSYTTVDNEDKETTYYYGYKKVDGEDKFYSYSYMPLTSDEERIAIKEELGNSINYIIRTILEEALYENFANDIKNNKTLTFGSTSVNLHDKYGSTPITKVGNKTLDTILAEYQDAKNGFLPLIFQDPSTVESDLSTGYWTDASGNPTCVIMRNSDGSIIQVEQINDSSGTWETVNDERPVTTANLKDIEFILQYAKQRGLEFADNFNTVIKEYIMDEIIEINGTPKYAWIDENDKSNTGNADAKAQWYTNLFKRMQQGYKVLEDGLASSKEWIEYALESGIVSMEQVDLNFNWKALDYTTCSRITEVTDDAAVAKAEAEYNRAMNDIKAKDNIYDLQLKNIDTEHTSLQTEYSVLEKVIQKNIERTFKFDQSA